MRLASRIIRKLLRRAVQRQALFRLDLEPFAPSGCQTTSSGTHILRLVRDKTGGFSATQQTLLVAATLDDSQLIQFSGDYIPTSRRRTEQAALSPHKIAGLLSPGAKRVRQGASRRISVEIADAVRTTRAIVRGWNDC